MRIALLRSFLAISLLIMPLVTGCDLPDGFGFTARVQVGLGFVRFFPNVVGQWISDQPGAAGSVFGFGPRTLNTYIDNGRCPARWLVGIPAGAANPPITPCVGQTATGSVRCKRYNTISCVGGFMRAPFRFLPENLSAPAFNNITIEGEGISESYGMPKVFVYDASGVLVGEATASSCGYTPGGIPWMNGTVWLPAVPSGEYLVVLSNQAASGGYVDIGAEEIYISGGAPVCDPTGSEAAACSASGGIFNYVTCHCDCACG